MSTASPADATRPLRILVLVNLAWDPRLGAVRVWIELAEQWRAAGHIVEKYCLTDAFPATAAVSPPRFALRQIIFPFKAAAFVRENADRFDVLDALIGVLPFPKRRLRFRGLVVARSVGLYLLYERFEKEMKRRMPRPMGTFAGRVFYGLLRRRVLRDSDRAVRHADLINVPNEDEASALRARFGDDGRCTILPYGLAPERARALAAAALAPDVRLPQQRICFIGMWCPRKGEHDWAGIITAVREKFPAALFRFLGTMVQPEAIHRVLGEKAAAAVEVVPAYEPDELPRLLADCTAGAFPSYVEGFGLAVIEKLAAGLPTVAYDTPGPRDILRAMPAWLLVAPGDVPRFAASLCRLLEQSNDEYRGLSRQAGEVATGFSWPRIARETIDVYRARLDRAVAK